MYAQRRRIVLLAAAIAACLTCAPRDVSYSAEPQPLIDKTLVVWARPANLEQRGSGTLSVLEADAFDSIVLAEVRRGVWMPGSDHFNQTETRRVLEAIQGNAMEIVAEVNIRGAPMVEMNVLRSPDKEEFTRIAFFRNRGLHDRSGTNRGRQSLITIDSSYASTADDVVSRHRKRRRCFSPPRNRCGCASSSIAAWSRCL